MKKLLLSTLILFITGSVIFSQTTANTNFIANDCNGTSHDLFAELNSGKIVVMAWVMPCVDCIAASRAAYDAVQSFATSNPGKVVFYLVDDYANTTCTSLSNWGNANGMTAAIKFSNVLVRMSDFGAVGMPKVTVIGGSNHTIVFNEIGGNNLNGVQAAINQALTGVEDNNSNNLSFNLYPNTIKNSSTIFYELIQNSKVSIEIINVLGKKVKTISSENQAPGKYENLINLDFLSNGIYFMKLITDDKFKIIKFTISH